MARRDPAERAELLRVTAAETGLPEAIVEKAKPNLRRKVWWVCPQGHEYQAAISNRTRTEYKHSCPICLSRTIIPGVNDLGTLCPNVAKEWDVSKNAPLTPSNVALYAGKKVWWKCSRCGTEYQRKIEPMSKGETRCPGCGYNPGREQAPLSIKNGSTQLDTDRLAS